MKNDYDLSDLLSAISKSDEIDEKTMRVFLYLFTMIKIGNKDGKRHGAKGTGICCLLAGEATSFLNITDEEYREATDFIVEHKLLNREYLEDSIEFWTEESCSKWLLKELGPNIHKLEDLKPITFLIDGEDNMAEFIKCMQSPTNLKE